MKVEKTMSGRMISIWERRIAVPLFLLLFVSSGCNDRSTKLAVAAPETNRVAKAGRPQTTGDAPEQSRSSGAAVPQLSPSLDTARASNPLTNEMARLAAEESMRLYNLGVRHFQGDGVLKSPSEAVKFFRQAADLGNAGAQHNLGVLYLTGSGVTNDPVEAAQWFLRSAEQGLAEAQFKLASLYAAGLGVTQDAKLAAQWARRAAEQGHSGAEYNLATLYASAQGVEQDFTQAAQWYRKAAEKGNASAQSNLGVLYARGQGVPQDANEAVKWFQKAAEQGHPFAQYNLARSYAEGKVVEKDKIEAYKWFILASDQGDRDAAKERVDLGIEMQAREIAEAIRRANAFVAQLKASLTNNASTTQTNFGATTFP